MMHAISDPDYLAIQTYLTSLAALTTLIENLAAEGEEHYDDQGGDDWGNTQEGSNYNEWVNQLDELRENLLHSLQLADDLERAPAPVTHDQAIPSPNP